MHQTFERDLGFSPATRTLDGFLGRERLGGATGRVLVGNQSGRNDSGGQLDLEEGC